jgi:iron(III) transport system permease protein
MPAEQGARHRLDIWGAVTLFVLGAYGLFLGFPLFNLLIQALLDKSTGQFTLSHFQAFFSKAYYLNTLLNSFKVVS